MSTLIVKAPAKVNLELRVTGKRPDGRHEIDAPTVPVGLYDTVFVSNQPEGEVNASLTGLPVRLTGPELASLAATKLRQVARTRAGANIHIHKNIPAASGLGGGSSDAAAVLIACNRLWKLHWPLAALAELGATIGADVPFFIACKQARMRGTGEFLSPLSVPKKGWLVLAAPTKECSTAAVYARFDADRLTNAKDSARIRDSAYENNDLLEAALAISPSILGVLDRLRARAGTGYLTGSGGCCHAWQSTRSAAMRIARDLNLPECHIFVVPILRTRPRTRTGEWPSGKATDFGSVIRRFESYLPSLGSELPAKNMVKATP